MTHPSPFAGAIAAHADARTAVIVFAKAPRPGQAKTRLIPALGARGAADLARRMLEHTLAVACDAGIGPVDLCVAPDAADPVVAELSARHRATTSAQGDGDLGIRMDRALTRALRSLPRALLIGTDCPALDAHMLRTAAARLTDHDAVFVPALDGGYVLVGLRRPAPGLFTDIGWSTPGVMTATRARARTLGLRLAALDPVADVDVPEDLEHLPSAWHIERPDGLDHHVNRDNEKDANP